MKVTKNKKSRRIGIFSGTFDPVHKGHIAFALSSVKSANLEKIYFAPEVKPRGKTNTSHFAHRVAMLKLATTPHEKLEVLELTDSQFTPLKTTPKLRRMFEGDQLFLLVGSDHWSNIHDWPDYETLLKHMAVVVGVREYKDISESLDRANSFKSPLIELHFIESEKPNLSSSDIRKSAASGNKHPEVLKSVQNYIDENWLYSSLSDL